MQLAVRLNADRDYLIAGVALAIILIALLFAANSVRTTITAAIG